jgi:hypothetical protein
LRFPALLADPLVGREGPLAAGALEAATGATVTAMTLFSLHLNDAIGAQTAQTLLVLRRGFAFFVAGPAMNLFGDGKIGALLSRADKGVHHVVRFLASDAGGIRKNEATLWGFALDDLLARWIFVLLLLHHIVLFQMEGRITQGTSTSDRNPFRAIVRFHGCTPMLPEVLFLSFEGTQISVYRFQWLLCGPSGN